MEDRIRKLEERIALLETRLALLEARLPIVIPPQEFLPYRVGDDPDVIKVTC